MSELISLPKCTVAINGASFDEGITFEEWAEIGNGAVKILVAVQWLIGDWFNFGTRRYIEETKDTKEGPIFKTKYNVALESLHHKYQYQSLANFAWVAREVSFSRRREKLSFSHHAEVAALGSKEQDHYLTLAEKNSLSVADLRELIRRNQAEVDDSTGPAPPSSPNHWTNQLSLWCAHQDPTTWPKKRREMVKQELAPLVAFYNRL